MPVTTYAVRYHAYLSSVEGSSLKVECPAGDDSTVERTARVNDLIFMLVAGSSPRGMLYAASSDGFVLTPRDLEPGDTIVTICPTTDIQFQSGNMVVICTDGTYQPIAAVAQQPIVQRLISSGSPYNLTGSVVIADTTQGDVVGNLPNAQIVRRMLVANSSGGGSLQINPIDGQTIGGDSTLVLGPSDRATLVATGVDWEVW